MRKAVLFLLFVFNLGFGISHAQMRNNRLFKVDPAGLLFRELRVTVENRIRKDFFWFVSPYAFRQTWLSRDLEPFGRPDHPQKYFAMGLRAGVRRYFFPEESSPKGFFVQGMLGYRHTWMQDFDDGLNLTGRFRYENIGFGGMVGYQWLYGPGFVPRKNFAYGVMGGLEFMPFRFRDTGLTVADLTRGWYQFPFLPPAASNFRIFLGVELGFAFLQKGLHW